MAVHGVEIQAGQWWLDRSGDYVYIEQAFHGEFYNWLSATGQCYSNTGLMSEWFTSPSDLATLTTLGQDSGAKVAATAHSFAANASGVGDIHSDAKGSGARFNTGKVPYDLVPIELMARYWDQVSEGGFEDDEEDDMVSDGPEGITQALYAVGEFQARRPAACLIDVLVALGDGWEDCARVFDYGQRKYKAFNWAKGMAWSIPIACATRHLAAMLNGEAFDPESGLPHRGHVYANICMLLTYEETFEEGDDRPFSGALADQEEYLG